MGEKSFAPPVFPSKSHPLLPILYVHALGGCVVQLAALGAFPGNTRLYTKIAKKNGTVGDFYSLIDSI